LRDPFAGADAVFFDIDGTLVDLFSVHITSYRNALKHVTKTDISDPGFFSEKFLGRMESAVWKTILKTIEKPAGLRTIKRLLRQRAIEFEKLLRHVSARKVLPGVVQTLRDLKKRGKLLFVFSGNSRKLGELILYKTALGKFFENQFFGDDSPKIINRADLLSLALRETGVKPAKALVVGDTPQDALAAKHVGMRFLGVSTGLHSRKELEAHAPRRVHEKMPQPTRRILRKVSGKRPRH